MAENNQQYNHSDESVVASMSELIEEMRTEVLDQLDKIQETQEEMEEKLSNLEDSLN
jgi:phage-related protein